MDQKSKEKQFIPVNLPRALMENLDSLIEQINKTGLIHVSSRAEGVKRAVEDYIQYLRDLLAQTK